MDMRRKFQLGLTIALAWGLVAFSGSAASDSVTAIRGGRFFTVTQGTISGGVLLIREGKIADIGKNVVIPKGARIIDASNWIVTPGFIDGLTNIGTEEPGTLGSDSDEKTSPVVPQLRIIDGFNPENMFIPAARRSGVAVALIAPAIGNLVAGQCGLIQLWGKDMVEMTLLFPAAMEAALGEAPKMRFGAKNQLPSTRMGEAALLRQTFIDAQNYLSQVEGYEKKLRDFQKRGEAEKDKPEKEPVPPAVDLKLAALIPVIKAELPLIVNANRLDDILTALRIADEFGLKIILSGGGEAYKVREKLAAKKIPVILKPEEALARVTLETKEASVENAALLAQAGVRVAFKTGSIQDAGGLLRQAQVVVSHGLPPDEALRALTINAAEIFGVACEIGSLEKGKAAHLVIFDGDPLRVQAKVKMIIIRGEVTDDFRR